MRKQHLKQELVWAKIEELETRKSKLEETVTKMVRRFLTFGLAGTDLLCCHP
jgi:hypothetical protein